MKEVPIIQLSHLSAAGRRAYVLADNKLALNAGWDRELLAIELQYVIDCDLAIEIVGFSWPKLIWCLMPPGTRKPMHGMKGITPYRQLPIMLLPRYVMSGLSDATASSVVMHRASVAIIGFLKARVSICRSPIRLIMSPSTAIIYLAAAVINSR